MHRLVVVLAVAVAACAGGSAAVESPAQQADVATLCGPVEHTVDQGHHHLVGDAEAPVDYATRPPTSGWHYRERGRITTGVVPPDDPLTEGEQVSVLAVGGVVVTYRDLPAGDRDALADLVARHEDRVALTPYEHLEPGEVALTAWRTRQVCAGYDETAVLAFIDAHAAGELDYDMHETGDPAHGDDH